MNKQDLIKILKTKYERFTQKEIKQTMDEELNKPVDEMDTNLIHRCMDALTVKGGLKSKEHALKYRFTRIINCSIVVLVLFLLLYFAFH